MKMDQKKETSDASLDEKIIRQVEYYFGDYNLPRDKFLQEQIKVDEGWIPLTTMLNFKRLAALTMDEDIIINALKKSPLKLLEVDEEKKKIRRSVEKPVPEMTESRQKEIQSRTVYCKGFTQENSTLDKLLTFFGQFASIDTVQMRTYLDKATKEYIFKGSVFVVFTSKDDADEFLKKDSVEYEGVKLLVKTQEDYMNGKKQEREEKKKMQKEKVHQATNRHPAGQKSQDDEGKESDEEEEKGSGFAKGALIHMKNVPKDATWEDIKSAVASVWREGAKEDEEKEITVAYVDHRMGAVEGWIRLIEPNTAVTLLERAKVVLEGRKMETGDVKVEKKTIKEEHDVKTKEPEDEKKTSKEENDVKTEEPEDEKKTIKEEHDVKTEEPEEEKKADSGGSGDAKADEMNGLEKDKKSSEEGSGDAKGADENVAIKEEGSESEEKDDDDVSYMEVGDVLVRIRAVHGTEEEEYLERVKEEREQRLQTLSRNKRRGGGHGGNRRGRGGRGGKRRNNWEGGPSHKRRR